MKNVSLSSTYRSRNCIAHAIYYLLIVVGIVLHWHLEVLDYVFFGKEVPTETPYYGLMPAWMQIFVILVIVAPLLFSFLSILCSECFCSECKVFNTISMVYSGLLGLLNAWHLVEQISEQGFGNFMQPVLLAFILAVNVVLFISLLKNCKCKKKVVEA